LHVFTYSDRRGTKASQFTDKISPHIVSRRHKTLRKISTARMNLALKRSIGSELGAISENRDEATSRYWGVTDNYLRILLPDGIGGDREIHRVRANSFSNGVLSAAPKNAPALELSGA
ncbi:MAG: hypothetical protein IIB00_08175, partial [candidate division Zixibacteria bacterium]|nr:hypothetical protein [candidate division Zixibacteria bacterium]